MFSIPKPGPCMQSYRAPSLFQPHHARAALRDAHAGRIPPLIGLYLSMGSPQLARFIAPLGWDVVWLDWEHSPIDISTMTTMVHELMFVSEGRTIPFVRVPGHDHASIGYALDAGASIVVPQVDTVEDMRKVVAAAKFGRKEGGKRSAPPFRLAPGLTDGVADAGLGGIHQNLNAQAAIVIQTESLEGVENLDAILTAFPEVDCCWLGSLDCRVDMGLPANLGMGGPEPEWLAAVEKWRQTCTKHDKPIGGFCLPPWPGWQEMGAGKSFLMVAVDAFALLGTRDQLLSAREHFVAKDMSTKTEKEDGFARESKS